MYPCRGLGAAIILYYFNSLGGRKAWNLQEHLAHCYRCRYYMKRLDYLSQLALKVQSYSELNEAKKLPIFQRQLTIKDRGTGQVNGKQAKRGML